MLNWLFTGYVPYGAGTFGDIFSGPQPVVTPPNHYTEERLHNLELACAALWELLKQKNGYTDEQLKAIIQGLSQKAGTQDGLGNPNLNTCPHCHHKLLTKNHTKCLWCGHQLDTPPFIP